MYIVRVQKTKHFQYSTLNYNVKPQEGRASLHRFDHDHSKWHSRDCI